MSKNELIYDLIFSNLDNHEINIAEYLDSRFIYKYDRFINEIKSILSESKVIITKEQLRIESITQIIWKIKTIKLNQDVDIQQ